MHHMQTLKQRRAALEADLGVFIEEKGLKAIIEEEKGLSDERDEFSDGIRTEISGCKEILESLKVQWNHIFALKNQGKSAEARKIWKDRIETVRQFLEEINAHFKERSEYLKESQNDIEMPNLQIDEESPEPDQFLETIPIGVPGINTESIKSEYSKALAIVNETFELQLQQIEEAVQNWPQDSHEKFMAVYKQYIENGKPRERYMEMLRFHFPTLSRQELENHDRVVEKIRWNKKHRKNILKDWIRHRVALKEAAENMLASIMDAAIERFNKELEFVKQQKQLDRLGKEIDEKRPEYLQKLEEKQRKEQELKQKELEENQKKIESSKIHQEIIKKQAGEYKEKKLKIASQEKTLKVQKEIQENSKQKELIIKNKPKVNERQVKAKIKQQEIQDKKEQKRIEQIIDNQRIEAAVQAYSHIPQVELDRERVQQNTKSKEAKFVKYDKADQVKLFPQTGFTAENLMKDMRYRISSMLNDAGLASTEYGKRIINAAPPMREPRRDTVGTLKF
ncbi:unnamed protein product [Blepharisma stoltei]|uniref:Uncharacterized protein n=1 Tax=Blepharisma stoltei TaxID=1481888 RepID=A0AAU9K968_9CILI|nr:unnamed protein product [Blepharisma stoltei]